MAINQTNVALDACEKISAASVDILFALDRLEAIAEQLNKSNIVISDYDAHIALAGDICHASGTTYQIVANEAGPEIKRALKAFDSVLSPGTKAWAAMQRVRR